MITSIHTLIYSDDANATRAFLRDVLGWKAVAEDFDNDWLIFKCGPSEMGVHPTHGEWQGQSYDSPRHHLIALMCDDIEATVAFTPLERGGADEEPGGDADPSEPVERDAPPQPERPRPQPASRMTASSAGMRLRRRPKKAMEAIRPKPARTGAAGLR